jgi:hypothetical protein
MRWTLKPHPDSRPAAITGIEVEVGRPNGAQLRLRYAVSGAIDQLLIPAPADPERTDQLWRSTCFEAFAQQKGAQGYDEFNFAPSTQWAAYRFDGYRSGMRNADVLAPRVEGGIEDDTYVLHAAFDLPGAGPWRLGLSAVIEETSGAKSYWALAHAPGQPDFHNADGFTLELSP